MIITALLMAALTADRPNILWLSSEDNGPQLGAYGDEYADTPNLDALAASGMKYKTCWSNAPVCAPARTTIITGMYPPSFGGQHMRSEVELPEEINGETVKLFPQFLRDAGYYTTNHTKTDYNLTGDPQRCWDDGSKNAHYRDRSDGQPFFAVFNETVSHESKIRTRPHDQEHDPAGVRVPAYHPDTPEVRQDWAQYYDKVTEMDRRLGKRLKDLEKDGLADDTIVIYFGDHGSGMPRSKRTPLDSGLRVPLIVRFPDKFKHLAPDEYAVGGTSDRLVSFVDFAATTLSIAGIEPPEYMQGNAFAGEFEVEGPDYLFGFRGRMDERIDFARSVTDGRYVYVRNYLPHLPHGQRVGYQFLTPTTRVWKEMYDAAQLNEAQARFWSPREHEALYDLASDPDEVTNIAAGDEDRIATMRTALQDWQRDVRDLGFLPEGTMHRLADEAGVTPYEYGHSDAYPIDALIAVTDEVRRATLSSGAFPWQDISNREYPAVGYHRMAAVLNGNKYPGWIAEAVVLMNGPDPEASVMAAEALAASKVETRAALQTLAKYADYRNASSFTAVAALNAVDRLGRTADPIRDEAIAAPLPGQETPKRAREYARRMIDHLKGKDWN